MSCFNENIEPTGEEPTTTLGPTQAPPTVDGLDPAEALADLMPTIATIPESEVRVLRVTVHDAVNVGLRVARAFATDRNLFEAAFKPDAFDPAEHDDIDKRTLALWQADLLLRDAYELTGASEDLIDTCKAVRSKLLRAAEYVFHGNEELGPLLTDIRAHRGYADLADDISRLRRLLYSRWNDIATDCRLTENDLDQAKALASLLITQLAQTESEELVGTRLVRDRAAEHLQRGVENIRKAAIYLFNDKSTSLSRYPSIYTLRNRRHSSKSNGAVPPETAESLESASVVPADVGEPPSPAEPMAPVGPLA